MVKLQIYDGKTASQCGSDREFRQKERTEPKDLAARCQLLGWSLSRGTLAKIECQTRWVADDELFCLAKVLNAPVESFLPGQSQRQAALQTFLKHRNETQLNAARLQFRPDFVGN